MSLPAALASVSPDRLRDHVLKLEGVRHPREHLDALRRAEAYVHKQLTALGMNVIDVTFDDEGETHRNIVATLPGSTLSRESILVLAHIDTVPHSPGADDNASGVASVLEIARVLAPLRFDRTLRFIGVNLEERGDDPDGSFLRGSRALLHVIREESWNVRAAIDLEMVGFAGDNAPQFTPAGFPVAIPKQGNFAAAIANEPSRNLAGVFIEAAKTHAPALPVVPLVVPGKGEGMPDVRRSDHAAFWDAGIPALMITDTANFRNPHYHEPTDKADTLNFSFMAEVTRATAGALAKLASL